MNSGPPLITLAAHGYRLSVSPFHGASLTGLTWQARTGEVSILRSCDASTLSLGEASPVSCFVMAPFANRIDGGIFTHDGRRNTLAINRPEEDVAIHGLSRLAPFEIVDHKRDEAQLLHRYRGDVFAYDLLQTIRTGKRGVRIGLRVTNRDVERMPFGIGLHPFFVRDEGTRLRFRARVRFVSDSRNLPISAIAADDGPDFRQGVFLRDLPWFDSHYAQWEPRTALLEQPDAGLLVAISARGAFQNLHVLTPHASDFVCIEPVSHVPDVVNRRPFAPFGDLHFLSPGESLSGAFAIEAHSSPSSGPPGRSAGSCKRQKGRSELGPFVPSAASPDRGKGSDARETMLDDVNPCDAAIAWIGLRIATTIPTRGVWRSGLDVRLVGRHCPALGAVFPGLGQTKAPGRRLTGLSL